MNIKTNVYTPNFGRAFTTSESKAYSELIKDAKKQLGIEDTTAIIFDFNVPSRPNENTAIGSTWSYAMPDFIDFIQKMTGISSIQLQPQGKIQQGNTSSYSGTNYALGEHIIDLSKLESPEYASILPKGYVKKLDEHYNGDKHIREYKTDYAYVLGQNNNPGVQKKALLSAFQNFQAEVNNKNPQAIKLNNEFNLFKQENENWLEKDALFETLAQHYNTSDFNQWSETDKNLYSLKYPENKRTTRIAQLKAEFPEEIEFEKFIQFIADKQQKESRIILNEKNIQIYGDCLIGFSPSEIWANKDCFRENLYYGGPDPGCPETNNIQTWGLHALDYTKLGECSEDGDLSKLGEVGKCLYDKYTTFFKRYDGLRMDAAWQFVTPFIYQEVNGNYEEVKLPEINFTILNIMKAAAKNALGSKFDEQNPDNIMLELVGLSAGKSREMTLNKYPHLYTTAYAEYDETPKKFMEKGYKNGKFYTGVGCHDNDSLVNMSRDTQKRELHLSGMKRDYNLQTDNLGFNTKEYQQLSHEEKQQENFRTAKFAELFTAAKQFFTLPDMFGMSERINISGKKNDNNWTVRIPSDYERFYFSQLANGYGLNIPKVFANAMQMGSKNTNQYLIQKCNEAAEILRSKGPATEQEANLAEKEGQLNNTFEYVA